MKKIKLLTSLIGLGLGSIIVIGTAVACSSETAENQGSTIADNDNNPNPMPTDNANDPSKPNVDEPNPPNANNPKEPNESSPTNPKEPSSPSGDTPVNKTDWQSIFKNKRVASKFATITAAGALKEIKTVNDLWNFYPKPTTLPSNAVINLINVKLVDNNQTAINIQLQINDLTTVTFLILEFAQYKASDYQDQFISANTNALTTNGAFVLPEDLNNVTTASQYYVPIIPEVPFFINAQVNLKAVKSNFNGTADYTYHIISADKSIATDAIIKVNGFYQFPLVNVNQPVTSAWIPNNDALIRSNIKNLDDKTTFNTYLVNHWNASITLDALNAIWWFYSSRTDIITANLMQYIFDVYQDSKTSSQTNQTVAYEIGYPRSSSLWHTLANVSSLKDFGPLSYSYQIIQQPNALQLNLKWLKRGFTNYGRYSHLKETDISGLSTISIPTNVKPQLVNGVAQITSPLNADIWTSGRQNSAHDHWSAGQLNILDALYFYYNMNNKAVETYTIKEMLQNTSWDNIGFGNNLYLLFKGALRYKTT